MENPGVYSAANALQRADAQSIMREFGAKLNIGEGARVLDVGCGTGDVTAEIIAPLLPKDVTQIIGVDLSESMIEHAKRKHLLPNLYFLQLDFEDETSTLFQKLRENTTFQNNNIDDTEQQLLTRQNSDAIIDDRKLEQVDEDKEEEEDEHEEEYEDEEILVREIKKVAVAVVDNGNAIEQKKDAERNLILDRFDIVLSFYCLHWIQNQRQALKNIFSLLKPGGEAILVFLADSTIYTMYQEMAKLPKWSALMQDVDKFVSPYKSSEKPVDKLTDIANAIGFQILTIECQKRNFLYEKINDLQEAIKAVNPFCSRLPEDMVDEYLGDCLRIIQQFKLAEHTERGYNVHYSLLIAHLKR